MKSLVSPFNSKKNKFQKVAENKLNDIELLQKEFNKNDQLPLNSQQNKQDNYQNDQDDQDYHLQQELIHQEASQKDDEDNTLGNSQHEDQFEQNYQSESKQHQNIQLSTYDNFLGKCLIQVKVKAKCD